jgi:hypothetical protein
VEDAREGKAYILEAGGEPGPLCFCYVCHSSSSERRVVPGGLVNILHINEAVNRM